MRHHHMQLIRISISLVFVLLISSAVNAQVSLVQNALAKLESYNSFSYKSITKVKEFYTPDTVTEQHQSFFAKAPADQKPSYLFNISTHNENDGITYTQLYNGQNLLFITPKDSTYQLQNIQHFNEQTTLIGSLRWILERLKKKSSNIIKARDTTIEASSNYHLIATVFDTIINKERNYNIVHLFMDKVSGMPNLMIIRARYTTFGSGVSTFYSSARYLNFDFHQNTRNLILTAIPKGFHLPKAEPALPKEQSRPLLLGSMAPDWTLTNTEGKTGSLAQLKGQVVLIDFFFIGCGGCMEALKPLDILHDKYKNQQVTQLSITIRDSKESALKFKKNYNIQYPIYTNGAEVAKAYHTTGFPTFYFIDKEGKVASVIESYTDDFEVKAASTIDRLLKM